MKRAFAIAITALGMLRLTAACSDEVIVLASVQYDGGTTHHFSSRCSTSANCESNEFCNFDHPELPTGHCDHRPLYCGAEKTSPVCGDDGVTYVNDCYRKQAARSSKTTGECPSETARTCDLKTGCPTGATCELLGGGTPGVGKCGPPSGHCWGLIDHPCDDDKDDDFGPRWDECSTEPDALRCVSTCQAIMSGRAFAAAAFNCTP